MFVVASKNAPLRRAAAPRLSSRSGVLVCLLAGGIRLSGEAAWAARHVANSLGSPGLPAAPPLVPCVGVAQLADTQWHEANVALPAAPRARRPSYRPRVGQPRALAQGASSAASSQQQQPRQRKAQSPVAHAGGSSHTGSVQGKVSPVQVRGAAKPKAAAKAKREPSASAQAKQAAPSKAAEGGRGRGRGRGRGGRGAKPKQEELAKFVRGIRPDALLEHAEEIQLTRQVQRVKHAEDLYAEMLLKRRREEQKQLHAQLHKQVADGEAAPAVPASEAKAEAKAAAMAAARAAVVVAEQPGTEPVRRVRMAGTPGALGRASSLGAAAGGAAGAAMELEVPRAAWAEALNVSEVELRGLLREGHAAKERIVASNVRLVGAAVQALKNRGGGVLYGEVSEQDLMQEGCISLVSAAQGFDVSLGCRFSTYATFWVRAALRRAIQEQSRTIRLPTRLQDNYGKIKRAQNELLQSGSSGEPTDAAVSEYLEGAISPEKVREIVQTVKARTSSLDAPSGGGKAGDGDSRLLVDRIEDEKSQLLQESMVSDMLRSDLRKLMAQHLTADERRVVALRFGLEDGATHTVRAVGEELGISFPGTKSLLFSALNKLRRPHVARQLKEYQSDEGL